MLCLFSFLFFFPFIYYYCYILPPHSPHNKDRQAWVRYIYKACTSRTHTQTNSMCTSVAIRTWNKRNLSYLLSITLAHVSSYTARARHTLHTTHLYSTIDDAIHKHRTTTYTWELTHNNLSAVFPLLSHASFVYFYTTETYSIVHALYSYSTAFAIQQSCYTCNVQFHARHP